MAGAVPSAKLMRVFITFPKSAFLRDYEHAFVPLLYEELEKFGGNSQFVGERDCSRADIIVYLESAQYKTRDYIKTVENDPVIRNHAERVYTINYDDHPEGMLAGLYTSIAAPFHLPAHHRSWPLLFMNNPLVYGLGHAEVSQFNPKLLFSFTGAESHAVRKRLFDLYCSPAPDRRVERIDKWYNHGEKDRRHFIDIALDSAFCLCPRGYAAYTNRIPEVMAMGRTPVIIADDWVPFAFESDAPYFIQIPEKDVEHVPDILSQKRHEAEAYGRNARMVWERNCSSPRRVVAALECIAKLAAQPGKRPNFSFYSAYWNSQEFLKMSGWTFRQQATLRLQQHWQKFVSKTSTKKSG